ncbi:MAG TPA: carboxylating nicotinate-nucleotide diphosphorylase [Dehalococcoidia bacterium]|nr:carboxylating nicotinate-nucleotide diphosphorylase [Dehalococcoidia bacterium]
MYKEPQEQLESIIRLALEEDAYENDITSNALISPQQHGTAFIIAKEDGILACSSIISPIFHSVDYFLKVNLLQKEGNRVKANDLVAEITGNLKSILAAERTVLNFLSHLSGIATQTAIYADKIKGTKAVIRDTRKTMPGLRLLEKYAVTVGGGENHRLNLADGILIKDNHIASLRKDGATLTEIIDIARQNSNDDTVTEIEINTVDEAIEVLKTDVDIIMLDNMSIEDMKTVVSMCGGKVKLEASGGINLQNIREVALTGVDYISIGALTHSVNALDFSLEVES